MRVEADGNLEATSRNNRGGFHPFLAALILAALYFIVAKLSLRLAFLNASASPVWPPAGITVAALLLYGSRLWPGIFIAAFAANLVTAGNIFSSFGIAAG